MTDTVLVVYPMLAIVVLTAYVLMAQGELVRELERQLLPPPAPKQRKGHTKH